VRDNASAVRAAARSAASAAESAQGGGALVTEVVHTMDRIAQASARIGDIIGTIDALAFQTNILALNAAVEAARAGEQGRGFAVVAGEVRTLALRSAEAAQQIRSLIQDSSRAVQAGQQQVTRAGDGIAAIVAQVGDMAGLLQRIDTTTSGQADTITEVHGAIEQLDRTTQHNMLLVDEAARASLDLQHRSEWLAQAAAVFRSTAAVPAASAPSLPSAMPQGYATGIAAA
jgi:methyl-accepting chemotaxis protein